MMMLVMLISVMCGVMLVVKGFRIIISVMVNRFSMVCVVLDIGIVFSMKIGRSISFYSVSSRNWVMCWFMVGFLYVGLG